MRISRFGFWPIRLYHLKDFLECCPSLCPNENSLRPPRAPWIIYLQKPKCDNDGDNKTGIVYLVAHFPITFALDRTTAVWPCWAHVGTRLATSRVWTICFQKPKCDNSGDNKTGTVILDTQIPIDFTLDRTKVLRPYWAHVVSQLVASRVWTICLPKPKCDSNGSNQTGTVTMETLFPINFLL